jgi:hypothetical protein
MIVQAKIYLSILASVILTCNQLTPESADGPSLSIYYQLQQEARNECNFDTQCFLTVYKMEKKQKHPLRKANTTKC